MKIDQIIYQNIESMHSGNADVFFKFFTSFGKWEIVLLFIALFTIHFLHKKEYKWILPMYLSFFLSMLITFVIKISVERPRPLNELLIQNNFSFPSGHATVAAVFYTFIFYYFYKKSKNKFKKIAIVLLAMTIVLLIGFSRIYLQVHYLTDVLVGYLIGFLGFFLARKGVRPSYKH